MQLKIPLALAVVVVVKVLEYDMWQIIVIMMVALGTDKGALEITHNDGKRLQFETQEICYAHVYKNLDRLKELFPIRMAAQNGGRVQMGHGGMAPMSGMMMSESPTVVMNVANSGIGGILEKFKQIRSEM